MQIKALELGLRSQNGSLDGNARIDLSRLKQADHKPSNGMKGHQSRKMLRNKSLMKQVFDKNGTQGTLYLDVDGKRRSAQQVYPDIDHRTTLVKVSNHSNYHTGVHSTVSRNTSSLENNQRSFQDQEVLKMVKSNVTINDEDEELDDCHHGHLRTKTLTLSN